ncbi:MAG: metallophosphoesterase, partial [Ignavibacteria bacterium]|nr:metallophosphoesterase [Ignavibacteria bacterium]
ILNSNYSRLSDDEIEKQKKWYVNKVNELEIDSTVNAIVVGVHHSSYTNSRVVDPSEDVQNDFVPVFVNSKKGKVFISGHAHAFEHFRRSGKDFLVIGGGGGLQHPLLMGPSQRWQDLFPIPTSLRMFHYVVCELNRANLKFRVMMLNPDFKTFQLVDEIDIGLKND